MNAITRAWRAQASQTARFNARGVQEQCGANHAPKDVDVSILDKAVTTFIGASMHLLFIAKNIMRAGDHATTIAEQALCPATGSLPTNPRPEGKATAAAEGLSPLFQ